ncbi:MAG: pyridoxamine 5'-phosphate oxidase family protein [Clostridiales bacterium]
MMTNIAEKIADLINKQSVAFISSLDEDGFPNTKAMLASRKHDGIKTFYFTTNTSSMRVQQYLANNHACLYFYDTKTLDAVMLKGNMDVLQDQASRKLIWQDGDDKYYPQGVTDPNYSVLRFTTQTGRLYSNHKSEDFKI